MPVENTNKNYHVIKEQQYDNHLKTTLIAKPLKHR